MRFSATPRRVPAAIAILIATLVLAYALGWLGNVAAVVARPLSMVAAPLHALGSAVSTGFGSLGERDGSDVEALRAAIERLRLENSRLRSLASENDALRAALDYRDAHDDLAVMARVVSGSSDPTDAALVIDRGTDDGIRDGLAAISSDGILIGKTIRTARKTAHVRLLADSRSKVAVGIQNVEGTLGVLEGSRGLSMAVRLIPQDATIAPGDGVVTSGIESGIRRGIPVGTVAVVRKTDQDPFQTADVEQYRAAANPAVVLILLSPSDPSTEYVEVGR